jgi:hypothetical protein
LRQKGVEPPRDLTRGQAFAWLRWNRRPKTTALRSPEYFEALHSIQPELERLWQQQREIEEEAGAMLDAEPCAYRLRMLRSFEPVWADFRREAVEWLCTLPLDKLTRANRVFRQLEEGKRRVEALDDEEERLRASLPPEEQEDVADDVLTHLDIASHAERGELQLVRTRQA